MTRKVIIEIIAILFIMLWVYAGVSKLLDYNTFKVQLGKSPLLEGFPEVAAVIVPSSEIIISLLLVFKRTRRIGLYSSLFMIVLFTTYLVFILNFSYYIPCSCGGILQGMTWHTHLIFNMFFVGLGLLGVVLVKYPAYRKSEVAY